MANKKIKILFYYPMFIIGGVEMAILNLLKLIDKSKFDISIGYVETKSESDTLERFSKYAKIIHLKKGERHDFDIVINCSIFHDPSILMTTVKAKKWVLWIHANPIVSASIKDQEFMSRFSTFICCSDFVYSSFLAIHPQHIKNTFVIKNIMDIEEIKNKAEEQIQESSFEKYKGTKLLTVCRISKEKGFGRIINDCRELKKTGRDFKWFIIGKAFHEEYESIIKRLVAVNQLQEHVIFLGRKENPYPYIKNCDFLCAMSDHETWALTINEARILNVPVITTNFSACHEQIKNMENGIIIPIYNNEERIRLIRTALEQDELKTQLKKPYFYDFQVETRYFETIITNKL